MAERIPRRQRRRLRSLAPAQLLRRLIKLLRLCRNLIPHAAVHVLSKGRRFSNLDFALDWAAVDNPNMMVGIPIYGAEPALHDYVVQSQGAFDATVTGILNLGRLRQRIEIRVVVHKPTAPHLIEIADFISRNLRRLALLSSPVACRVSARPRSRERVLCREHSAARSQ